MAVLRPHLALTVTDVERSIPFYEALLGVAPAKVRDDYAKFEVLDPALNLTLNTGSRNGVLGAFNHAGIQVESTDDVLAARLRLQKAGLATFDERQGLAPGNDERVERLHQFAPCRIAREEFAPTALCRSGGCTRLTGRIISGTSEKTEVTPHSKSVRARCGSLTV